MTSGLRIENPGTELACISHNGKPLLAFGPHFEHMFFNDYDYESWTEWAADHGMNHCRTRLYNASAGSVSDTGHSFAPSYGYTPFVFDRQGRFNLEEWDEAFWERFHRICTCLQSRGIIIHLLIFPQCTGRFTADRSWVYHPDNNVHPETEFLRNASSTERFWQTLSRGKARLYEIQTALLWKLVDESARYDNIYYDLCHEPFMFQMSDAALADAREFIDETTRRFFARYRDREPEKLPVLGMDTDFVPPGEMRDWIYGHDRFTIMIKGNNNDQYYTSAMDATALRRTFGKPFCPQECCDLPRIRHIPDCGHPQNLTYYWPHNRVHLRKYVWRWMMAKTQVIDIYQKGMGSVEEVYANRKDSDPLKLRMMQIADKERYDPRGHNPFEKDARVLRSFWNGLRDYSALAIRGEIVKIHFRHIRRVLSWEHEAVVYFSSEPGVENERFNARKMTVINLALDEGRYTVDVWNPAEGIVSTSECAVEAGMLEVSVPDFMDDIVLHVYRAD